MKYRVLLRRRWRIGAKPVQEEFWADAEGATARDAWEAAAAAHREPGVDVSVHMTIPVADDDPAEQPPETPRKRGRPKAGIPADMLMAAPVNRPPEEDEAA